MVVPKGIATTGWPSVRAVLAQLGIDLDWWQEALSSAILGKGKDGKYAADAVCLSIPRQVGKTYLVGALIFALCIIFPKTLAIWTAHHGATAADTFQDLKALAATPAVKPYVRHVYDSGARQEIIFNNGSRIRFGAREHGFGRGFKRVGILVFDEAQILSGKSAEDMVPTTNRHPNPLIFYMGTPPKPSDPCDHFLGLRLEAIHGESKDTLWCEFSADADADELDRVQWAKANPSYPKHTSARAMLRMRKNLKAPGAFRREALGIWDDLTNLGIFPPTVWSSRKTDEQPATPTALGLAVDADRTYASIAAATKGHVGAVRRDRFGPWVVDEVVRIALLHNIPVALDVKGPVGETTIDEIERCGVQVIRGGLEDYIVGCADFVDGILKGDLVHGDYAELNAAVDAASWRAVGDRRVWSRKNGDITMLEAATWARWAASEFSYDITDSFM